MKFSGSVGDIETCAHGNVAPISILQELPESQAKPARHRCAVCAFVEGVADYLELAEAAIEEGAKETNTDLEGTEEGATSYALHKKYERDPKNRAKAIIYHGTTCKACGFRFDKTYTKEHARDYIEVHHLKSLSLGKQMVDPKLDLVPLCANCHRMVHRRQSTWLSIEELTALLKKATRN